MRLSANKLFAGGATLLVCAALIGGFVLNGAPSQVRLQRLDEQKLGDLRSIASAVRLYYSRENELPDSLEPLDNRTTVYGARLTDRETGDDYEYRKTGDSTYELCATFHLASGETRDNSAAAQRWAHEAGHQCIVLDANDYEVGIPTFDYY